MLRPPYKEEHYEMMGGVCLQSVRPHVCLSVSTNLEDEKAYRKPKIGRIETHHTGNP